MTWRTCKPPTPGGVIYVHDDPTGMPTLASRCFSVYANDDVTRQEADAEWLADRLNAADEVDMLRAAAGSELNRLLADERGLEAARHLSRMTTRCLDEAATQAGRHPR